MKSIIKNLLPPIILKMWRSYRSPWRGNYGSWEEALSQCTSYDSLNVFNKVASAALKVASGKAVYERDSVLFDKVEYSWPLATALAWSALKENGKLRVLDFGGGLGSSFFQNEKILDSVRDLRWFIIEQPKFVELGREKIENNRITFCNSISELSKEQINLVLVSSTLQYLEKPFELIDNLINLSADMIIIDRLSIIQNENTVLTKQTVPNDIYEASYPSWFFCKQDVLDKFLNDYDLISEFDSFVLNENILNYHYEVKDVGFLFTKKCKK